MERERRCSRSWWRRSDSEFEDSSSDLRVSIVRVRSSVWAVRVWMVCSLRSSSSYNDTTITTTCQAAPQHTDTIVSKERTSSAIRQVS